MPTKNIHEDIIVVLNDGSTYSNISGAEVRILGDRALEELSATGNPQHITAARYFNLTNPVHLRMLADYIEENRW